MTTLPLSIADYAVVPSVALTSSVDMQVQYRQIGFGVWTMLLAAGGTPVLTSNSVTAGAGNNLLSEANIVNAAAGTAHSWGVVQFAGATPIYILVDFDAAVSANPRRVTFALCTSPYTGGTTTNRPTPSVGGTETVTTSTAFVPWSVAAAGNISYGTSASGQIGWFMIRVNGATDYGTLLVVDQPDPADLERDNGPRMCMYVASGGTQLIGSSIIACSLASLQSGGFFTARCWLWNFTSIPGGLFADARGRIRPVRYISSPARRDLGSSRLIAGCPQSAPINGRDPLDPVGDLFTWWNVGLGTMLLWPKSAGDLV